MIFSYKRSSRINLRGELATVVLLACSASAVWTTRASALPPIHSRASSSPFSHFSSAIDSTGGVVTIDPGDTRLRPDRVAQRTDTIALLVTPSDSAESVHATLVRRVARVTAGRDQILRETQHYQFADGSTSDDTLDVRASTLAPVRYFSKDRTGTFDVRIDGMNIKGWKADSIGTQHIVQTRARAPFFVSIMSEAFAAAFPFDSGAALRLPLANPPSPDVRMVDFRAGGVDTLNSAHGRIVCQVITGPGQTTNWIARSDGRLVRLRWTLPNGTTIWKLPAQDAALR
jgi:hypothetical protein